MKPGNALTSSRTHPQGRDHSAAVTQAVPASPLREVEPPKQGSPAETAWQSASLPTFELLTTAPRGAVLTPITDSCRGIAFLGRVARGAGAQLAAGLRLKSAKRGTTILWRGSAPLWPHKPGLTKPDGRTRLTEADAENLYWPTRFENQR